MRFVEFAFELLVFFSGMFNEMILLCETLSLYLGRSALFFLKGDARRALKAQIEGERERKEK